MPGPRAIREDGESSSGRTSAFGAEDPGSNPGSPANPDFGGDEQQRQGTLRGMEWL